MNMIALIAICAAAGVQADLAEQAEAMARPMIEDGTCVGLAIGLIDGSKTVVIGLGEVTRGGGEAPDGGTLFEIGSISKPITGLLLADMTDRGLVRLDEPVQDLLPEGVSVARSGDRPITLLDLATHTSGLPRLPGNFRPDRPENPYADYTVDQLYEALADGEPARKPGEESSYSNLGVGLLGHALALRAGMSFEDLLRERVCEPIGMGRTRVAPVDDPEVRFANGYAEGGAPSSHWDLPTLAGAGGIRSTVDDMLRFLLANLEPDSTPIAAAIRSSHEVRFDGPGGRLALCWIADPDGGEALWHNGGTGGFHSFAAFDPGRRVAVVVLCNTATFEVDRLGFDLLRLLQERRD